MRRARVCVCGMGHQHGGHILTQGLIQYSFRNGRFTLCFALSLTRFYLAILLYLSKCLPPLSVAPWHCVRPPPLALSSSILFKEPAVFNFINNMQLMLKETEK